LIEIAPLRGAFFRRIYTIMSVIFMSSLARTDDPHLEVHVPLMYLFRF